MRIKKITKIFILILFIGGVGACVPAGELKEENLTVQLGEAETVELDLDMGSGKLKLQGGALELMEVYFAYNIKRWKPEVDYDIIGTRGMLEIKQGESSGIPVGKTRNTWEISLSNDVPIAVKVDFGAGEGKLDFSELILESLDVDMGVGDLTIDLTGEPKKDLDVDIEGGVGSATIYLPENIGVRVDIDGGIGSINARDFNKSGHIYTNDAFGKTDVSIDIKVDAGIGSIDLELK